MVVDAQDANSGWFHRATPSVARHLPDQFCEKAKLPGRCSSTSVPSARRLKMRSFAPIRSARSRIPRKPGYSWRSHPIPVRDLEIHVTDKDRVVRQVEQAGLLRSLDDL